MRLLPWSWWSLTKRWLFQNEARKRHFLFQNSIKTAILGLSLGVAALSLTLALVSGIERSLSQSLGEASGHFFYNTGYWQSNEELLDMASKAQSVERVESYWSTQGLLVGPKGGRGVRIDGREIFVPQKKQSIRRKDQPYFVKLNPAEDSKLVYIDLGRPLAERLGVEEGEDVRMSMFGVFRGSIKARVRQLVEFGYYDFDSRFARIDSDSLRRYLFEKQPSVYEKRPGDAFALRFFLDTDRYPFHDLPKLEAWRKRYLKELLPYDENPVLLSWKEQEFQNFFTGIEHDRWSLALVLSLLTVVASLNVAATLLVLFLERDRDIALLQAVGLSPGQLQQWLCLQGFFLGIVSTIIGFVLSFVMAFLLSTFDLLSLPAEIYNVKTLPFAFLWKEQLLVFLFGLLSGIFVAMILGWRLSKVPVLRTLGHRR